MRGERSARSCEQHVIVIGSGDESPDGDETVAARAVLDHHRLTPPRAQSVGKETCADIDPASRPKRYNHLDRALRPGARGLRGRQVHDRRKGDEEKNGRRGYHARLNVGRQALRSLSKTGQSSPIYGLYTPKRCVSRNPDAPGVREANEIAGVYVESCKKRGGLDASLCEV